ncbi:putative phosphatase regulatory subunit-domain-containing protein [Parasitella parasitica]|nr:putative phosphatase regulatory subunit-domain-containing protein [Parasitella parasitica]
MGFQSFSRNQTKWGRTDWSRPSYTTSTIVEEAPEAKLTPAVNMHISKPRFSVFGKTTKFTEMNKMPPKQDAAVIEANTATAKANAVAMETPMITTVKKKKFELHLSTKSSANYKFQQQDSTPPSPSASLNGKKRPSVKFNPIFLERVCLFLEAQSPCELKEAHDKHSQNPPLRIICPRWPSSQETTDYYSKNILLDKNQFSVSDDNSFIKGKLMVRNLALDKSVSIRYTFDAWTTVQDVDASFFGPYLKNTSFDIYEFAMELGYRQLTDRGEMRGKLEFAVRFTAGDKDYWDNNNGRHYQIKIISDPLNDPWATEKRQLKATNTDDPQEDDKYADEDEDEDEDDGEEEKEKHSQFTNALKGYKHAKPFHLNKRQPWLGTRYDFGQSLSLAKRAPYESWATTVKANPTIIADYFLVKPISIKPASPSPSASTSTSSTCTGTATPTPSFASKPNPESIYSINTPSYLHASKRNSNSTEVSTISASAFSKPVYVVSTSAPPSPKASPTIPAATITRPPLHHHSNSMPAAMSFASSATSPLDINSSYYLDLVSKYCFYTSDADLENQPHEQQQQSFPINSI